MTRTLTAKSLFPLIDVFALHQAVHLVLQLFKVVTNFLHFNLHLYDKINW